MTSLVLQMVGGMLVLNLLTVVGLLFGWLSLRPEAFFPGEGAETGSKSGYEQSASSLTNEYVAEK